MIVDCHCHVGAGEVLTGPWDVARLDRYLRRADQAGIGRTVLFATFHGDYAVANRVVAQVVASRPERFLGFAFVHPQRDAGRIGELVGTVVRDHGFCGIKAHRHDGPLSREVCEVARTFAIPVLYDVMGEVATVELFATEYPEVDFIVPHLGSFADDWRAQLALTDQLERHPNVFTDTSGVRRFDLLAAAVQRAGPGKVLFGSDGPWLHPGVELAKVRALGLAPDEERLVLGGNLLRLVSRGRPAATRRWTGPRPAAAAAPGR
jgi:uncharacterized protein